MSDSTLREALAELLACHTESAGWSMSMVKDRAAFDEMLARSQERVESAVSNARAALAADDAARGTAQEQFEAWAESTGKLCLTTEGDAAEITGTTTDRPDDFVLAATNWAWRAWQASRAAAPQSVEPPAPTDAEWQEEAMRLAREWADNSFKKGAGYSYSLDSGAALRSHIATRPQGDGWIACSERLPKPGVKVFVFYRNSYGSGRRTCAHYSPLHTISADNWDDGTPDETEDGAFEPEGWWEEPVESERIEFISDEVTHWRPLPAPPTKKEQP